jgi:hypothetical protein
VDTEVERMGEAMSEPSHKDDHDRESAGATTEDGLEQVIEIAVLVGTSAVGQWR